MLTNQVKPADNLVCTCLILMEGKDVDFQVNGPFEEKGFVIWNRIFYELEKKEGSNITNNCNIVITKEQEQSFVQSLVIAHPSLVLGSHCTKQSLVDIWGQQPPFCTTESLVQGQCPVQLSAQNSQNNAAKLSVYHLPWLGVCMGKLLAWAAYSALQHSSNFTSDVALL